MVKNSNSILFQDISHLIESAKNHVARQTNSTLVNLYWRIGNRINQDILKNKRAEYGNTIIKQLAQQLTIKYGRGFNTRGLFKMVRFVKLFPDETIVPTLSALLSWSHFDELTGIEEPLKRQFYTEMCRLEHWSVRELRKKIDGMLYERTAISHKPEQVIQQDLATLREKNEVSQDLVFRDPYILDFLSLPNAFSESNLEYAILDEITRFLQELGNDFCFIGRQKRIMIDNDDYYIDLLTFHRSLRRLVAIELKLGKFTANYKGQMELYLNWLNKYERKKGENKPLGLILCAEKKQEHIELLELNSSGIHVAQYLTQLPPKEVLGKRLRRAIEIAQEKQDKRISDN
ncbi:MAG TPA: PDDEXK nuclease domain-containing protein [Gammaproteobacteria bacterium]|nr:PDDEXK nuclease domain-containing protein [Gammaproteobacteria bacterium]